MILLLTMTVAHRDARWHCDAYVQVAMARQLALEWQAYVVRAHALRKVFVSVKGFYFQVGFFPTNMLLVNMCMRWRTRSISLIVACSFAWCRLVPVLVSRLTAGVL